MQNEKTLLELGFVRYPDWDFKATQTSHYRKNIDGNIFRAYEVKSNGISYISMGRVVKENGIVSRWMDCCSNESVSRKIKLN